MSHLIKVFILVVLVAIYGLLASLQRFFVRRALLVGIISRIICGFKRISRKNDWGILEHNSFKPVFKIFLIPKDFSMLLDSYYTKCRLQLAMILLILP